MDFFNSAYRGTPPWDIGHPQKEFVGLVRRGEITGSVLDIGCGTGEHALFFAEEGHEVWGIDSAPLAIGKATGEGCQTRTPGAFSGPGCSGTLPAQQEVRYRHRFRALPYPVR